MRINFPNQMAPNQLADILEIIIERGYPIQHRDYPVRNLTPSFIQNIRHDTEIAVYDTKNHFIIIEDEEEALWFKLKYL